MDRTVHPDPAQGAPARAPRLVLASTSPRRADLLRRHGVEFDMVSPGIDDALLLPGAVSPAQWVAALAYLKARGGVEALGARAWNATVLGADTLVVKNGRIIGQPVDADDARRIIRSLEDGPHDVVTGVALLGPGHSRRLFTDRAIVRVGEIGPERLDRYVASGAWRGKAGGYNLEERLADGWPIEFEGDAGTIVGLPMRTLAPLLANDLDPDPVGA